MSKYSSSLVPVHLPNSDYLQLNIFSKINFISSYKTRDPLKGERKLLEGRGPLLPAEPRLCADQSCSFWELGECNKHVQVKWKVSDANTSIFQKTWKSGLLEHPCPASQFTLIYYGSFISSQDFLQFEHNFLISSGHNKFEPLNHKRHLRTSALCITLQNSIEQGKVRSYCILLH